MIALDFDVLTAALERDLVKHARHAEIERLQLASVATRSPPWARSTDSPAADAASRARAATARCACHSWPCRQSRRRTRADRPTPRIRSSSTAALGKKSVVSGRLAGCTRLFHVVLYAYCELARLVNTCDQRRVLGVAERSLSNTNGFSGRNAALAARGVVAAAAAAAAATAAVCGDGECATPALDVSSAPALDVNAAP
jgi:hypothetical protein